jgi:hypothetical protein
MRALPNDRWRNFVTFYLIETFTNGNRDNYGAQAAAFRKAGFGTARTRPNIVANHCHKMMRDERMVAAIGEESRKLLRAGAPEVVKAALNMVRNPEHPGHARAVSMLLDRTDPITTHHDMTVTHRVVDPDQEALEEMRAARALGADRRKLIELFGPNGLDRLEILEAADNARRAEQAKLIDGEIIQNEGITADG